MGIRRRGFPQLWCYFGERPFFSALVVPRPAVVVRASPFVRHRFGPLAQFKLDLGDLDLTTDEINFDKIDEDLGRFQQDEIVKEALEKVLWWVAVW